MCNIAGILGPLPPAAWTDMANPTLGTMQESSYGWAATRPRLRNSLRECLTNCLIVKRCVASDCPSLDFLEGLLQWMPSDRRGA